MTDTEMMTSMLHHNASPVMTWVDHRGETQFLPMHTVMTELRKMIEAHRPIQPPQSSSEANYKALAAAYGFVSSIVPRADRKDGASPLWYGWAIREGFMAGYHYVNVSGSANEELARDAARYHWLRSQFWETSPVAVVVDPKKSVQLGVMCPSGKLLDALIDRHMNASMSPDDQNGV